MDRALPALELNASTQGSEVHLGQVVPPPFRTGTDAIRSAADASISVELYGQLLEERRSSTMPLIRLTGRSCVAPTVCTGITRAVGAHLYRGNLSLHGAQMAHQEATVAEDNYPTLGWLAPL
jgi:hypothetical protein